jgi:hypothetical protein
VKLTHFFIDHPIFATVVSLFITIVGGVAFLALPVAQYPEIAPAPRRRWLAIPSRHRWNSRSTASRTCST